MGKPFMIEKNVFERCLLYTFVGLSTYFFVKRFFPEKSKYDSEYNLNLKGGKPSYWYFEINIKR
jgi:hypothetical protein